MTSENVNFRVPGIPEGYRPAACWRRRVTTLHPRNRGAYVVEGEHLMPSDEMAGTLILSVDKQTTGWDTHYKSGERYALEDSRLTVHVVDAEAENGLKQLWSRHYKTSRSAFGATTLKKLAALLEVFEPATVVPVLVREAQRPNEKQGTCRHCGVLVYPQAGHLVTSDPLVVEHYEECPPKAAPEIAVCVLCSVSVLREHAQQVFIRRAPGQGHWQVQHTRPEGHAPCFVVPPIPAEVVLAEEAALREADRAAAAKAQAALEARRAKAAEKAEAKRRREQIEHEAEQNRIQGLATLQRESRELSDKGLGDGHRARLTEHTDHLEDGSTTQRWSVETYSRHTGFSGEDYDPDPGVCEEFTQLKRARAAYQELKFQPVRVERTYEGGPRCDNCDQNVARTERRDSSGIAGMVCARCDEDEDFMLSFG